MRDGDNQHSISGRFLICYYVDILVLINNKFHNDFLQALEEGKFELSTVFLVVQEMLTHWPKVVTYIGSTGPLQVFQHVVGRISTSVLVPLFDTGWFMLLC